MSCKILYLSVVPVGRYPSFYPIIGVINVDNQSGIAIVAISSGDVLVIIDIDRTSDLLPFFGR